MSPQIYKHSLYQSINTVTGVRTSMIFPSFKRSSFALLHNAITSLSDINSHLRNYSIIVHSTTIITVEISRSNTLSQHIQFNQTIGISIEMNLSIRLNRIIQILMKLRND